MRPAKVKCAVEGCGVYITGSGKTGVCRDHMHSTACRCAQCRGTAPRRVPGEDRIPRSYRIKTREELGLPPEGAWQEWHGGDKWIPPWEVAKLMEGAG